MKISFDEHLRKKQRDELYEEFDKVCLQKLHMTSSEVRGVFLKFEDDMFEEFDMAFEEGGPDAMWYKMMHRVAKQVRRCQNLGEIQANTVVTGLLSRTISPKKPPGIPCV